MPKASNCYKWLITSGLYLLVLCYVSAFAQTTKVNELQLKLKQSLPDTARLQVLKQLTEAYSSVDPQKKFYYATIVKQLAEKLHDNKTVADAYINMGISYGIRSRVDSALYYFSLAYNQAQISDYPLGLARSLADMGYAYDRLDNKKASVDYYFKALAIFKKIKYERGIVQCNTNIGSIYYDLKQYKLAKSYFDECLKSVLKSKNQAAIGNVLYALGNCYQSVGRDDKAMESFSQSLAIRKRIGDANGTGLARMGLGIVYRHKKQYAAALSVLDSALTDITSLQDKYEEIAVLSNTVDVYLDMHNYNKAEAIALRALSLSRGIKAITIVANSLDRLVQVYKGKNDITKAFKYQSEYVAEQDSFHTAQALKDITLTEYGRIRTENADLAKSNGIIAEQNNNYLARLKRYLGVIVVIAVGLVFAALFVLILYRRNREKQITNRQLMLQKQEIAVINTKLELLNEEINKQIELTNNQNIELERVNDIKNKFFSIISHDLRSPISTLQSLLSIYREGILDENELSTLISQLEDTIINTGTFLDNLLEWSKSQMEGIIVRAANFDVSVQLADNIRLYESKIIIKKLKVINRAGSPVIAYADSNMINLVIRNILSNSIKFCKPTDSITLSAVAKDGKVLIGISDTGPGISEAEQKKIFSLEHTLSRGNQGEKGNHLGLILCRDMMIQNNGRIWFDTQVGEGTTFWVELPAGVR